METTRATRTLITVTLIVLHLAIAIPLASILNIWADEASTLFTTQNGLISALQNAAANEKQAPLYFWLLSLWRLIDDSIFFSRLFSIFCSVAAIAVFANVARRIVGPRGFILATAFFALHPFLFWASTETRVYSLVILLAVLLAQFFISRFLDGDGGVQKAWNKDRLCFVGAAIIGLYTNYYIGFLLVGFLAALLVTRKWPSARDYALLMIVAGIAFLPMLWVLSSQLATNTSGYQEARSVTEGLRYIWHHVLTFVLPAEIFPGEDASRFSIVRLWLVRVMIILGAYFTIRHRHSISRRTAALGVIAGMVGALMLSAYFLLGPAFVAIRHASVLFVPLILFMALLISDLFRGKSERSFKAAAIAGSAVILASFSYSLLNLYPEWVKRGDWERVGRFIQENESPGQPIVVFTAFDALALPYHYRGINEILPNEGFFDVETEAAFGTAESHRRQTERVIAQIRPEADKIWLAVNDLCLTTEACRPLENFVLANYTVEIEKEFYLEKLYLLKRKQ